MMKISEKYEKFLDEIFDKYDSWSEIVTALVEKFKISADYADKLVMRYIGYDE